MVHRLNLCYFTMKFSLLCVAPLRRIKSQMAQIWCQRKAKHMKLLGIIWCFRLETSVREQWRFSICIRTLVFGALTRRTLRSAPISRCGFAARSTKRASAMTRTTPGPGGTTTSGTRKTRGSGCLPDRSSKCYRPTETGPLAHIPLNHKSECDQPDLGTPFYQPIKLLYDTIRLFLSDWIKNNIHEFWIVSQLMVVNSSLPIAYKVKAR